MERRGGFAKQFRGDASCVMLLPEGLAAEPAGALFCGKITVFKPIVQYCIKPTDRMGVIGIGGLGHLAPQFLDA